MRPVTRNFISLPTALLLAVFSTEVSAQSVTNPNPAPVSGGTGAQASRVDTRPGASSSNAPNQRATRNRAKLAADNNAAWQNLNAGACKDPTTSSCADAAVLLANSTCSSSAVIFQRGSAFWTATGFAFVIASAAFTGVGASTTISQAKVFSTLGGTTGLGAVTATVNSNTSNDQGGVTAVNALQADLETYRQSPTHGADGKSLPSNNDIYLHANSVASTCVATAAGSGKGNSTTPPTVTGGTPPAGAGGKQPASGGGGTPNP